MTSREQYPWLQQSRTLLVDAYWPPLNPKLEFDADKLIKTVQDANANTIRFGTIGKYALIQNEFVPLHPELGERDLLRETLDAACDKDIKIIAYVAVGHGLPRSLMLNQRPQWKFLLDDGSVPPGVRHFGGELTVPPCPFGQYYDDILNFITYLVDNYAIDGLYLDGPYYNWNMMSRRQVCQCEKCQQLFSDETGLRLPANSELFDNDEIINHELVATMDNWIGARLYQLFDKIIHIAKYAKNLPVMFNAFAAAARPPQWEQKMLKLADGFLLEAELGGLRGLGVGDYYQKIIWRYTHPHTAWPRISTPNIERQNQHSGYETLTWGGVPIISYGGRLCFDNCCQTPVAELFGFMKNNQSLLEATATSKFIGIVSAQRINALSKHAKAALAGSYKLFQSAGVQTGIVTNGALVDLQVLQQYPIIFFPGDVIIGTEQAACLREYVRTGGTMIATGNASLCDNKFLLKDLFGVTVIEPDEHLTENLQFWSGLWDIYLQWHKNPTLLPVTDFKWIRNTADSECLAEIIPGTKAQSLTPAIIRHPFGAGTCFYINFPIERLYNELEVPEFVNIIETMLDTNSEQCPVKIACSHRLYLSLKEKASVKVIYLCNPSAVGRTFTVSAELKSELRAQRVYSLTTGNELACRYDKGLIIIENHSFENFEAIAVILPDK